MIRRLLFLIIIIYVILVLAYASATPPWQNPDEPAHYNYAREIADHARLPVLSPGDYDQDALERLKASKFSGNPDVSRIRYESYQPPLYYVLGGVLIRLVPGAEFDLYALRLLSAACGALVLVATFAIGRELAPEDGAIALAAAALVAFIPQHLAMTAAANNDTLGELLLGLMALLAIRRMKGLAQRSFVVAAAILLGLALLTKVTAYAGVVILAAGELGHWWLIGQRRARLPIGVAVRVIGGALLISGWWFVRNVLTYGNLDILGLARHDQVVIGQPRTVLGLDALRHFVVVTFQSFWAIFGWMGVLVDVRIYWLLALLTGLMLAGLVIFLLRGVRSFCPWQRLGLAFLALQLLLVAGVMLSYNLTFIQPQGRYLFAASAAIGVFFVLGLRELIDRPPLLALLAAVGCAVLFIVVRGLLFVGIGGAAAAAVLALWLLARRWYRAVVWTAFVAVLVVLDVVCLLRFIVPALAV